MNIYLKRVDDENIIYIKCDDDIDNKIDEDVEVDINENEIDIFYVINKDIILCWNVFLTDKKGLSRKENYPSLDDTSS